MIVTRMALPRRTVLRGLGATLALPLLDSMVPALTATARTPARAPLRFGVVYVPNGMVMQEWTPAQEGAGFAFPAAMKPLEPFRDRITVLSGLANNPPPAAATGAGVHARASTRFLTNIPPKRSDTSDEVRGRTCGVGREEPHRVARLVADQRNQPDQRDGEQRHPEKLAETAR